MRLAETLLAYCLLCTCIVPIAAADYPELDRAPFPTLSAVPSSLESDVDTLRGGTHCNLNATTSATT